MNSMKCVLIMVLMTLFAGCASTSDKQLALAQASMQQGDYLEAFRQSSQSLQSEIGNYKTIALFPSITENAYAQKLVDIDQFKAAQNWDKSAHGYDDILDMNRTVAQLQQLLKVFASSAQTSKANRLSMNNLLALKPYDVAALRSTAYEKAAEIHYSQALGYVSSKSYRLASQAFNKSLSFINPYKDAVKQAAKSKHLADLSDAKKFYIQGTQSVQQKQHRAAAVAFAKSAGFIANYKDASKLAAKYKTMADQEDALTHYNTGVQRADDKEYRSAAQEFKKALGFVSEFRDAHNLAGKYTKLANEEDARKNYEDALQYMEVQEFARAAEAFRKSEQFVPRFRDANFMAGKAASYIPPTNSQLERLVQDALIDKYESEQPVSDFKVSHIWVEHRGRFDKYGEFWPYKIRVKATFNFHGIMNGEPHIQVMPWEKVLYFQIAKTGYGDWKAEAK